jgi:hypothetical protein
MPAGAVAEPGWTNRAMRTGRHVTGRAVGPGAASRILERVNPALSAIPLARRRRASATLGLFAALFLAVGAVALTGDDGLVRAFAVIALLVAVFLALTAWGVLHSVRLDVAEQRVDAVLEAAVAGHPAAACGCGHEHDPDELHVQDACEHDGSGTACEHDCETCVVAALRPSPTRTRAERR